MRHAFHFYAIMCEFESIVGLHYDLWCLAVEKYVCDSSHASIVAIDLTEDKKELYRL